MEDRTLTRELEKLRADLITARENSESAQRISHQAIIFSLAAIVVVAIDTIISVLAL